MTTSVLFENPSTPDGWNRWSWHHRNSHDNIRDAIFKKTGARLFDFPIDPMSQAHIGEFLQANSQLHIDMDGALRLQSSDLLDVEFDDDAQRAAWIHAHAEEHRSVELELGI